VECISISQSNKLVKWLSRYFWVKLFSSSTAFAQTDYPTKPVQIAAPFTAGGLNYLITES